MEASSFLRHLLDARLPDAPTGWRAVSGTNVPFVGNQFLAAFASATRDLGKAPLDMTPAEAQAARTHGIDWSLAPWGRDELGRAVLLLLASEKLSEAPFQELVEECYRAGQTYGQAFQALLSRLMAGYGLIFLDPLQPEIRELAAPMLHAAFEQREELGRELRARGKELEAAGYHAQVLVDEQLSLFFRLQNGIRTRLGRDEAAPDNPAELSPNALLRPVMQDYLLPTAAYVGGPAELAYLAQSQVLYRALLGRMPVAVPRGGFTLLDERAHSLMDNYNVSLTDCFHGYQLLRERIAARLIPDTLEITFQDVLGEVRNSLDRLQGELHNFDPTLGEALKKSRAKIIYQIEKNRRKAANEALRRDARVVDGAAHLSGLVFPERHLQERLFSILPFLAKHGFDLIDTLYENVHRGCPDHLLMTI